MNQHNKKYILVIDIGTTNCKVVLFDYDLNITSYSSKEIKIIYNRLGPGWIELDAEMIWNTLCNVIKDILNKSSINPKRIIGIGVTALRQTILAVDKSGNPIRFAIPWCNKSTYNELDWIEKNIGEEFIYRISGVNLAPINAAGTFRYLIKKEPEIYEKSYKLISIQNFVLKRLGVKEFIEDYSQASPITIFDLNKKKWSNEICDKLGLSIDKLSLLVPPGTIVGNISRTTAILTGLAEGTPLVSCGGDTQCSAVGCGVISEGIGSVVIGTSAISTIFSERPVYDPNFQLTCHAHSFSDKFIIQHTVLTGGIAYKWYRDLLFDEEIENYKNRNLSLYKVINGYVNETPIGSNGLIFLPHLMGAASPYWDFEATGVFFGITQATTKREIARSIVEGVCLEASKGFLLSSKLGIDVDEIRLSGGVSRKGSPWNKIQADIYGKPVLVSKSPDTTALGAALLTGISVKLIDNDMPGAIKKFVEFIEEIKPDMSNHEKYNDILEVQNKIYESLSKGRVYHYHLKTFMNFDNSERNF